MFSRPLHYRAMGNGEEKAEEKGVDVRIAVDIRAVLREECDVALMFSQDQDFSGGSSGNCARTAAVDKNRERFSVRRRR